MERYDVTGYKIPRIQHPQETKHCDTVCFNSCCSFNDKVYPSYTDLPTSMKLRGNL